MADEKDQDALAAEWAAALEDQEESGDAGAKAGGNDKLADEWAAALAEDEQKAVKKEKEKQVLAAQASTATFKNMAEEANAPRVDSGRRELDFILDIPLDVSRIDGSASVKEI